MSVWFIRCNGETAHNEPGTTRYMRDEPPTFPNREFNYRDQCLCKGFARVGWPATGDLRDPNWRARALRVYGDLMKRHHVRFLEQFVNVALGDLVLLPTYQKRYQVYLGIVVRPRRLGQAGRRQNTLAYYYHFNIADGDWYDNAHRVDVDWAKPEAGMLSTFDIPEVGGTWIRGFGQVQSGVQRIARLAEAAGLIQ